MPFKIFVVVEKAAQSFTKARTMLSGLVSIVLFLSLAAPVSAQISGGHFSWGGGGVVPPFGNYNPAAGGQLSLNGPNFSVGMNFAQGSSRSITSQTPSLIVPNGGGGLIFNGQMTPFVTGMVPIVGSQPLDNAVTRAVQSGQLDLNFRPNDEPSVHPDTPLHVPNKSTANQSAKSLAAIKAERERAKANRKVKFDEAMKEGRKLLGENQRSAARQKFREALQLTDDPEIKKVLKSQIESLRTESGN